jgi:hypothetical protein
LSTEEKKGTTFKSSTDEVFETLTWNNKVRSRKEFNVLEKNGSPEHCK